MFLSIDSHKNLGTNESRFQRTTAEDTKTHILKRVIESEDMNFESHEDY